MTPTPRGPGEEGAAPAGRRRDPRIDDAITAATKSLLEESGLGELTIESIARRAGVSRTTVYRRWPSRDALLLHLLRGLSDEPPVPDRGHVRDDLIEFLSSQLAFLERRAGKAYVSLGVHAHADPTAKDIVQDLIGRRKAALGRLLERGIERDQIRRDLDFDLGFLLLWAPVYYRFLGALADAAPIERDFIDRLVDNVLLAIGITPLDPGEL
jgi:AcrR family transcriptional regulator